MATKELSSTEFTYFTEVEDKLIQKWLKSHGYTWNQNTVCGDCCGMYEDEYWVNGIPGEWKSGDAEKFGQFCEENGIGASVSGNTISAYVA